MRLLPRSLSLLFFIAFFIPLLRPLQVHAKSATIDEDKVNIIINKDKSISVLESLTYNFDGEFQELEYYIPTTISAQDYSYSTKLSGFYLQAQDRSKVQLIESKSGEERYYVKWEFPKTSGKKTFQLQYQLQKAIRKFPVVSELYWQIVSADSKIIRKNVQVTVNLPKPFGDSSKTIIYPHSPIDLKSEEIDARTIIFSIQELQPGTPLEIRVVFPTHFIIGKVDVQKSINDIEDEEKEYKDNQLNAEYKEKTIRLLKISWPILWLIIVAITGIWWFWAYRKYGTPYKFTGLPALIKETPSEIGPALVAMLLDPSKFRPLPVFIATIFDLERKGYIVISKTQNGLILALNGESDRKLLKDFEIKVIGILDRVIKKQAGGIISFNALAAIFRKRSDGISQTLKGFQKSTESELKNIPIMDEESEKVYNNAWIATIILTIITFNPLLIAAGIVLNKKLKRWNARWTKEVYLWRAFSNYVERINPYQESFETEQRFWKKYLIFGIVFGSFENTSKTLQQIYRKNPDFEKEFVNSTNFANIVAAEEMLVETIS